MFSDYDTIQYHSKSNRYLSVMSSGYRFHVSVLLVAICLWFTLCSLALQAFLRS